MKALDEALGGATFRTILLPGIVGAAALHLIFLPELRTVHRLYDLEVSIVFLAEVILIGLVLSSAARPIYWIYEGFQWKWLTSLAGKRNKRLVTRWQRELVSIYKGRSAADLSEDEEHRVRVLHEKLCDFPKADPNGNYYWFLERPTRLGNIIASYELYPRLRYDIDGRTYWYHLLNLAPLVPRKEFDEQQNFARSLVLTSFAGACIAVGGFVLILGLRIGDLYPMLAILTVGVGRSGAVILTSCGAMAWASFYLLSFAAHRDAGDMFRAIVDDVHDQFTHRFGK